MTLQGFYSKQYYLVHYEGLTEEEAQKVVAEAQAERQPEVGALFGEE